MLSKYYGKRFPKFRWLRRPMLLCQLASFLTPLLLLSEFMNRIWAHDGRGGVINELNNMAFIH